MNLVREAILASPVPVLQVAPRAVDRLPAVRIVVPVLKVAPDPEVIREASLQHQPLPSVNPILANQDI